MLTDLQAAHAWIELPATPRDHEASHHAQAIALESEWRQVDLGQEGGIADITISRWEDSSDTSSHEATTPEDRYFVGITLKTTRAKLTRDRQIIFDGTMPAGTLYVSGPSKSLGAIPVAVCVPSLPHRHRSFPGAVARDRKDWETLSCCVPRSLPSSPRH